MRSPANTRRAWITGLAGVGWQVTLGLASEPKAGNPYKSEQLGPYLQATEWILYSLDPVPWKIRSEGDPFAQPAGSPEPAGPPKKPAPPEHEFHGHAVLGQLLLQENEKLRQVIQALDTAGKNWQQAVAACFNPRHGIRVVHEGKKHDLLICYECSQTLLFIEDERAGLIHMNPEPQFQATPYPLDGLLNKAKIKRVPDG